MEPENQNHPVETAPAVDIVTQNTTPRKHGPISVIIGIILTIIGSLLILIFVGMALTSVLGPKVDGTFSAQFCHLQSEGGRYPVYIEECYGTFTTNDGKVSVDLKDGAGNEVATPGSNDEGKTFKAYAIASGDSSVTTSSQIITGNGLNNLQALLWPAIAGILILIIGIVLIRKPNSGHARAPESGTSSEIEKLRARQNTKNHSDY